MSGIPCTYIKECAVKKFNLPSAANRPIPPHKPSLACVLCYREGKRGDGAGDAKSILLPWPIPFALLLLLVGLTCLIISIGSTDLAIDWTICLSVVADKDDEGCLLPPVELLSFSH